MENTNTVAIPSMQERHRIGTLTATAMTTVALFIDGLQALLTFLIIGFIINPLIQIFAWILFYLWFHFNDVKMLEGGLRKAILFFGGGILELIPIINALPVWTLTTGATILIVKQEDASYNKKMAQASVV